MAAGAGPPPGRFRGGSVLAAMRQWRYPGEFRIAPARWPAELAALAALAAAPVEPADPPEPVVAGAPADADGRADRDSGAGGLKPTDVVQVATELWRLRRQLSPVGAPATPEARRALRRLDAAGDTLAAAGVEVQDHDGAAYDSGQNLTVLAFEETDGLTEERVVQTLRPTVYLAGRLEQAGEVIVGTPPRPD